MYSKVKEKFYLIGLSIMLIRALIENSNLIELPSTVDLVLIVIPAILLGLKIIMEKYTIKEYIIILIAGIFCVYTSFLCDYFAITMSYLTLVGIKNINISKALKVIAITIGIYLLICFIYFLWFYITDRESLPYYAITDNNTKRFYIFFNNPNSFAAFTFWSLAIYLYLLRDRKNIIKYIIYIIINALVYYFTVSRTTLILSIILLCAFFAIEKNWKICNEKLLKFLAKYSFLICAVFSLLSVVGYNIFPSFFDKIDDLLSRRISLGVIAYEMYGMTFLPKAIEFPLVKWKNKYAANLTLDNAYIRSTINFGIIYLFIIYWIILKGLKLKNDKYELILIIVMSISALSECYIFSTYFCFPILILMSKIFENNKEEKEVKFIESGNR